MADLITGVFYSRGAAEAVVDQLETLGYEREEISVMMHDQTRAKEFAEMTGTAATGDTSSRGAKIGAGVGGALAAIVSGIAVKRNESSDHDSVVIPTSVADSRTVRRDASASDPATDAVQPQVSSSPGVSSAQEASKPFIAGPLGATLAGASVGGLIGALAGAGVDKKLAERYQQDLAAGGIVIGVASRPDSAARVRDVLRNDANSSSMPRTGRV